MSASGCVRHLDDVPPQQIGCRCHLFDKRTFKSHFLASSFTVWIVSSGSNRRRKEGHQSEGLVVGSHLVRKAGWNENRYAGFQSDFLTFCDDRPQTRENVDYFFLLLVDVRLSQRVGRELG
jgi:hypothetical protein